MRKLIAVALILALPQAVQSAGVGFAGSAFLSFGDSTFVPNVIGEADSAAAETALEAAGLDIGTVTERCSDAPDNEVVGQDPAPGERVDVGSLVDVLVSNGVDCTGGKNGTRLRGLRMRGI